MATTLTDTLEKSLVCIVCAATFQACQSNGWEILQFLLLFEHILWHFRLEGVPPEALEVPLAHSVSQGWIFDTTLGSQGGLGAVLGQLSGSLFDCFLALLLRVLDLEGFCGRLGGQLEAKRV